MAIPMSRLLEEVSREHFPHPPAMPEQIEEFERRVGWKLDPDLRAFYPHCNGAELIERLHTPYPSAPGRRSAGATRRGSGTPGAESRATTEAPASRASAAMRTRLLSYT
jgi:hypothetical protein